MKNKLIAFFSILFSAVLTPILSAQVGDSCVFKKGAIIFSIGYGFPNMDLTNSKSFDKQVSTSLTGLGPVHGKFEYGISDKIGFGITINYDDFVAKNTIDNNGTTSTIQYTGNSLSINGRINFHFANSKIIDPYCGFGFGYRMMNYTTTFYDNSVSNQPTVITSESVLIPFDPSIPLGFEATIGLRVFLNKNIGFYTEVGISKSLIQVGLSVKLP